MSRVIFRENLQKTKNKSYRKKQIDHNFPWSTLLQTIETTRRWLVVPLEFWTFYEVISMVYLSNRPHFLWVYRRDNPRGMLGELEKSF